MRTKSAPAAFRCSLCIALLSAGIFVSHGIDDLSAAVPQNRRSTATPAGPDAPLTADCLISSDGIGPVRLGQTLDNARQAMPSAKFTRTSDGDGAALVEVTFAADASVTVSAGEDDADAPIDWSKTITEIETFSPRCHTADGIRPRMPVVEVERVLGAVKQIVKSEIESREYVLFERQPASLTLRLDYTGEFAEGSRETRRFSAGAKIYSVIVSTVTTP
jgi:hypothetical protein